MSRQDLARFEGPEAFPDARLESSRLLLRPSEADDAPDVALACRDPLMQRWLPLPSPYTDADAMAWCTTMSPRVRTSGNGIEWAAVRRSDGRLIGSFGLKRTDWMARSTEIGYWVAPWARGEGLAGEAVMTIARWLFAEQRFERLVLRAATGNTASQRVAEKAGFTREGVARNAGFTNHGRVDLVIFSLVPSDLSRIEPRAGSPAASRSGADHGAAPFPPGSVVVVTGIMGAGKTTVAQLIAERIPRAVHVRGDAFRKMIVSGRAEMTPSADTEALAQLRLRYELGATIADRYAEGGFTVVYQDIVLGDDLAHIADRIAARPLFVVVLAPAPDTALKRATARSKESGYGEWTAAALDEQLRGSPRIGLWIDSTGQDANATVDEIFRSANKARVGV